MTSDTTSVPEQVTKQPVRKLVIVGGSIAGWTVAAILARELKKQSIHISLIETSNTDSNKDAESGPQNLRALHEMLGMNERQLMSATQASFKLGTQYNYGSSSSVSFIHSFGKHGVQLAQTSFEQAIMRLKLEGDISAYNDYFLAAVAAKKGKFALPNTDPKSILSTLNYGLHLDSSAYKNYLKSYSQQLGVNAIKAEVLQVHLRESDSFIEALTLSENQMLFADLWIDCSGRAATLIGEKGLKVNYQDWSEYLPANRVAHFSSSKDTAFLPLTQLTATEWGWHKRIPLQNRTAHQCIFYGEHLNDSEMTEKINPLETATSDITFKKVSPGCRTVVWKNNCIAMGTSACDITSLAISELQLVQSASVRLLDYFPNKNCLPYNVAEYNRLSLLEIERARNFHIAIYHFMYEPQSSFGKVCSKMTLPDELQHRVELFRNRGRITASEYELIADDAWVALFLGLHMWPKNYDIFADSISKQDLLELQRNIKIAIERAVTQLPSHQEFIAHYCPSR
jgi:tryptophan 7-halogenase